MYSFEYSWEYPQRHQRTSTRFVIKSYTIFDSYQVTEFGANLYHFVERPHSRYWYEFAIFLLTLVLIILFGSLAYVYISKSKKINSLKLRAEYSNLFGRHESRITVTTMDD